MSANRYRLHEKVKLAYFVLPAGKTYSRISFDGFLTQIYKKRVNPKEITVETLTVEIISRTEHNPKDVGFYGKSDEHDCENQLAFYRKDSLYLLGLIPKNKYDYEWMITVDNKINIKGFDARYLKEQFSKLDKRFDPLLQQVNAIV